MTGDEVGVKGYPPKCQYRVITLATNLIHMTQNLPTYLRTVPTALSTRLATPVSHAPQKEESPAYTLATTPDNNS